MKKIIIGVCVAVVVFFGLKACKNGVDPVDFAKAQVNAKFEGLNCDLSKLDFDKVEVTDETALIKVEGKILYNEEISLVKENGKWVVGAAPVEEAEEDAPAEKKDAHAKKKDDAGSHH